MFVRIWNQFVDKIQVLLHRAFDFWWNDYWGLRSVQSLSHDWLSVNTWTTSHRLPCPPPTPRTCSNSCSSSWWCHPTISSSVVPFSSCLQSFPVSSSFPMCQFPCIRWLKHWSFSISHYNEYSVCYLNDYLWDWLVVSPWSPRDSQESSPTAQFKSINSLALSFLYSPTLTSVHDYWKNHSFDYMNVCQKSNVSAF